VSPQKKLLLQATNPPSKHLPSPLHFPSPALQTDAAHLSGLFAALVNSIETRLLPFDTFLFFFTHLCFSCFPTSFSQFISFFNSF